MLISDRLKKLRKEKGLTQKELAKKIQVHELTVQQYELGKRSPQADILIKLAEALNVSTDYLLCATDDPTPLNQNKKESEVELYPGQAQDLIEVQKILESLNMEELKIAKKILKSLNSESD